MEKEESNFCCSKLGPEECTAAAAATSAADQNLGGEVDPIGKRL